MQLGPLNAVHVTADGDHPPVILIHGIGLGSWLWERDQRLLAEQGYSSYAVDLPGHGSDQRDVRLADCVDAVVAAIAALDTPPILVGHSFGGLVAQVVASKVEVSHLVLIAPVPCGDVRMFPSTEGIKAFAPSLPALLTGRPVAVGAGAYLNTGLHLLSEADQQAFLTTPRREVQSNRKIILAPMQRQGYRRLTSRIGNVGIR